MAVTERPLAPGLRLTQWSVIRSEWVKFRSLRSTTITLLVSAVLSVGIGALITGQLGTHPGRIDSDFDAASTSLAGTLFSQLAVGVLGVLCVTGEYKTGMIRSSLAAVPTRLPVLWGKAVTLVGLVFPLSLIASLVSFVLGQSLLSAGHLDVGLGDDAAVRKIVGSALYLAVAGLIGLAIGVLLRSSAGAITSLVGAFFVIPPLLNLLPSSTSDDISPYLPAAAGQALWGGVGRDSHQLAPWTGFGVMCLWAAALLVGAAVRLATTDV